MIKNSRIFIFEIKLGVVTHIYIINPQVSLCVCMSVRFVTLFKISTYYPIETKLSMSLDATLITCLHRPELLIVQLEQVSGDHFS